MRVHLAGMRHAHAPADSTSPAPVSVPHLVLDVHPDGTLTATLNHHPVARRRMWGRGGGRCSRRSSITSPTIGRSRCA